jgi:hypothetical protein
MGFVQGVDLDMLEMTLEYAEEAGCVLQLHQFYLPYLTCSDSELTS